MAAELHRTGQQEACTVVVDYYKSLIGKVSRKLKDQAARDKVRFRTARAYWISLIADKPMPTRALLWLQLMRGNGSSLEAAA
jgi:hypothetical protein